MPKYDFSHIKDEAGSYGPGKHLVKFGDWLFDENKTSHTPFLQINFTKNGYEREDGKPFTYLRLFFSDKSLPISRKTLHLLCDHVGVPYSKDRTYDSDSILAMGEDFFGKEIEIELVSTGVKNNKGYDFLEVQISGVTDWLAKPEPAMEAVQEVNPRLEDMDNDVPF